VRLPLDLVCGGCVVGFVVVFVVVVLSIGVLFGPGGGC